MFKNNGFLIILNILAQLYYKRKGKIKKNAPDIMRDSLEHSYYFLSPSDTSSPLW